RICGLAFCQFEALGCRYSEWWLANCAFRELELTVLQILSEQTQEDGRMITTLVAGVVLLLVAVVAYLMLFESGRVVPASELNSPALLRLRPPTFLAQSHSGSRPNVGQPRVSNRASHLTKQEAENLLDWLEATGKSRFRVTLVD